jgi:hypothetical protein
MQIDTGRLNAAIQQALTKTIDAVAQTADQSMTDERWQWDGYTVRRNGQVVGSPRDIVDTGELYRSRTMPIVSGDVASFEYLSDYADEVHRDRPWLTTALLETDIESIFAEALRALL